MAADHAGCEAELREMWECVGMRDGGPPIAITVSITEPLEPDVWAMGYTCPHGVQFWIEPTPGQKDVWRLAGTL